MKKGFTLAEVLITLGVIGVVAVLTIPGVMKNYKNRLYVSQLEKVYSQLTDATQAIMNDEHVDNFYETTAGQTQSCSDAANGACEAGLGYFLNNYFKVSKRNCLAANKNGCMSSSASVYKTISGTSITGASANYCIQTVSGAAICGFYNPANSCMSLVVDVNGIAEPNVAGRDVFSMDIHKNGSFSDYGSGCVDTSSGCAASSCTTGGTNGVYDAACGCTANVIEAGWKMNY
jgi:prepilin-type N-terminal cleavage/methylation domain-containing protein